MSLTFSEADSEEAQADLLANEIQQAFSRSKLWEYERLLGNGGFGVTMLLRDKNPLRLHRRRRVVLKRPLLSDIPGFNMMQNELVREIGNLKVRDWGFYFFLFFPLSSH
jgi:hypothetical protein